jgi:hypothetical protein
MPFSFNRSATTRPTVAAPPRLPGRTSPDNCALTAGSDELAAARVVPVASSIACT